MDIRSLLRAKGLTQRDVARRLNRSDGTISKYLDGKIPIPGIEASALARMIGVKRADVIAALAPKQVS